MQLLELPTRWRALRNMVLKQTVEVSWEKLYLGHEGLGIYIPFECQTFSVFSNSSVTLTSVGWYVQYLTIFHHKWWYKNHCRSYGQYRQVKENNKTIFTSYILYTHSTHIHYLYIIYNTRYYSILHFFGLSSPIFTSFIFKSMIL